MNKSLYYKLLSLLLIIVAVFLFYSHSAQAGGGLIGDIFDVFVDIITVVAVIVIVVVAGVIIAQVGLILAPIVFTTLVGTALVTAVMVGAGLWAADCLFDGSAIDPNIICTDKNGASGGPSFVSLQADVRVNGSDGPISLLAPADFTIQWVISGADQSTSCTATDDWSGDITNAAGEAQMSSVNPGNYNYGIMCNRSSDSISSYDFVAVFVVSDVLGPSPGNFGLSTGGAVACNSVPLSWTAASGADAYRILKGSPSGDISPSQPYTALNFTDTTVSQNTTYPYQIEAYNSAGTNRSNTITVTTPYCSPLPPTTTATTTPPGGRREVPPS